MVGRPYYDFFLRIFGLPLLLLMGIGPLIAWRRASLRGLGRTFLWPFGRRGRGRRRAARARGGLVDPGADRVHVLGVRARRDRARVRPRHDARGKALSSESWPGAFFSLIGRNRRRYGGYVVHVAIVLLAIGIAGSSAYDSVVEGKLAPGQSLAVSGYTVTYQRLTERETAARRGGARAPARRARNGETLGTLEAGKNSYKIAGPDPQVSSEVGIRTNYLTGEDLFVIPEQVNDDGTVYFRIFVKPLVNLIWLAGLVFLLGSVIALWPDAREQRRLAVRYDEAGSPVRGR